MKFSLLDIIYVPLGYMISFIYDLVKNYGLSIIIFTLIVKLIIMPLNVKSQRAMKKQQKLQPALNELQKKYANDQQKLQQEMMKLYKDNGVSMAGGCLPMLVQFPILIGLYSVIRSPLKYILHVNIGDAAVIERIEKIKTIVGEAALGNYAGYDATKLFNTAQIQLAKWSEQLDNLWKINFNFLGMDLSKAPSSALSYIMSGNFKEVATVALISIPILAVLTTWLSMKQSQQLSGQTAQQDENPANQMSKSMTFMMPIMTGFFTLTLPSGMGIYWIVANIFQMVQQVILNKIISKEEDDFVVKVRDNNRKNRKKRK